jgi:hypothetical protein
MMEVFVGNREFHVEDAPDPDTGALQTWVRVTEGLATCAECRKAKTVVGDRHRRIMRDKTWWTQRYYLEQEAHQP